MKRKKFKRKWSKSEKITLTILSFCIIVFICAIIYAFLKEDSNIWTYLIPSVGALGTSAFGFFIWKAKNENLPKILNNPNYDQEQFIQRVQEEYEETYHNLDK